jgi:hypothetical protein
MNLTVHYLPACIEFTRELFYGIFKGIFNATIFRKCSINTVKLLGKYFRHLNFSKFEWMHINFANIKLFTNTNAITVHTLNLEPLGHTLEMFSRSCVQEGNLQVYKFLRAKLGVRSSDFQVSVFTVVVFVDAWCCRACSCVIGQFKVTRWFLIVDHLSRDLITRRFELWGYRSKATCWTVIREQVVTSNRRNGNHHRNFSTCATNFYLSNATRSLIRRKTHRTYRKLINMWSV